MTPFWIALQFLTVFPIQLKGMPSAEENAKSLLFYPMIGLLIGLILFAIAYVLISLPVVLLSSLILVLWIWLTGGLHLDGLADTADAWVGGFGDPKRTLAIMKDPNCGPIGVLSLIMCALLKWSAIYVVLESDLLWLLLITPMLARIAPIVLFRSTNYVRQKGLGSSIKQYLPKTPSYLVIIITSLLSVIVGGMWGILMVLLTLYLIFHLRLKWIKRINGITGDTIGATIELVETLALFIIVCAISFY